MPTTITTLALRGTSAVPVHAVCAIEPGMPAITVIGCNCAAEVAATARCAIRSAGFTVPRARVVVQLDPTEIARSVTQASYPLAVTVAILVESGQVPPLPEDVIVHGSLSIDGTILPMRGDRAVRLLAREQGLRTLAIEGLRALRHPAFDEPALPDAPTVDNDAIAVSALTRLPESLARLAAVAAVGHHDVLLVGRDAPLAAFARAVTTLMGPLDAHEAMEVAVAHNACDLSVPEGRPVRFPHHSITLAGMVGGGRPVMPGEVTLADHGVLALADLPLFSPRVLDAVRVAHDDGMSRIVRVEGITGMPARFVLVSSTAPCPCGHLGDPDCECSCSPEAIRAWRERVPGHLNFDIVVDVPVASGQRDLVDERDARRLVGALEQARVASAAWPGEQDAVEALEAGARRLSLSDRARGSVSRVARSLAALDGAGLVGLDHVLEALSFAPRV